MDSMQGVDFSTHDLAIAGGTQQAALTGARNGRSSSTSAPAFHPLTSTKSQKRITGKKVSLLKLSLNRTHLLPPLGKDSAMSLAVNWVKRNFDHRLSDPLAQHQDEARAVREAIGLVRPPLEERD